HRPARRETADHSREPDHDAARMVRRPSGTPCPANQRLPGVEPTPSLVPASDGHRVIGGLTLGVAAPATLARSRLLRRAGLEVVEDVVDVLLDVLRRPVRYQADLVESLICPAPLAVKDDVAPQVR